MRAIRLSRGNGITVELRGIAAMQWRELSKIRHYHKRLDEYYRQILMMARSDLLQGLPHKVECRSDLFHCNIITVNYNHVTVLCYCDEVCVTIFWMSRLFRPDIRDSSVHTCN
jgi:hypothetical protein